MKKNRKQTVFSLARECNLEVDLTLLTLWENGFDEINFPGYVIQGKRLDDAKKVLNIPTGRQINSIKYWATIFKMDEVMFREYLQDLKIEVSVKAQKLPAGAIRILTSKAKQQNLSIVDHKKQDSAAEPVMVLETVKWREIGHKEDQISCLSFEEVLQIHYALVADFKNQSDPIEPAGLKNETMLHSAIHRQSTSMGEVSKYPTTEMTAAALGHSLVHNHPFHNGNKRTALVALLVFLDRNDIILTCSDEELFKFILTVAQHRLLDKKYIDEADREVLKIAEWIKINSRYIEMGDRPLAYRKLKQILNSYGCDFKHSGSGIAKINREIRVGFFQRRIVLTSSIPVVADGREVVQKTIDKIRKELQLTEEFGIDSAAFYENSKTAVDQFILRYRKILNRMSQL